MDPALAQHIAHLFTRDPLVVFNGRVQEVDNAKETDHFESIQSTNWQSVRWKPPPPRKTTNDPHIGWRTEFRSMEIQLTGERQSQSRHAKTPASTQTNTVRADFENSAFTVFIVLATRAMLLFDLNLYVPLSRVDANMQRAHSREAATKSKFFFRRHLAPLEEGDPGYDKTYEPVHSSNGDKAAPDPCDGAPMPGAPDGDGVAIGSTGTAFRKRLPCATGGAEENSFEGERPSERK